LIDNSYIIIYQYIIYYFYIKNNTKTTLFPLVGNCNTETLKRLLWAMLAVTHHRESRGKQPRQLRRASTTAETKVNDSWDEHQR